MFVQRFSKVHVAPLPIFKIMWNVNVVQIWVFTCHIEWKISLEVLALKKIYSYFLCNLLILFRNLFPNSEYIPVKFLIL